MNNGSFSVVCGVFLSLSRAVRFVRESSFFFLGSVLPGENGVEPGSDDDESDADGHAYGYCNSGGGVVGTLFLVIFPGVSGVEC